MAVNVKYFLCAAQCRENVDKSMRYEASATYVEGCRNDVRTKLVRCKFGIYCWVERAVLVLASVGTWSGHPEHSQVLCGQETKRCKPECVTER